MDTTVFFRDVLPLVVGLVWTILPLIIGWRIMTGINRIANILANISEGLKNKHIPN
ncbi:MAG: hypothetical protein ABSE63_14195 [Thermoguttaceae bacterium]|jgi:hypothetical protein